MAPTWVNQKSFFAHAKQFCEPADVLLLVGKQTFLTLLKLIKMLCFYFLLSKATMASLRGLENYSKFVTCRIVSNLVIPHHT